MEHVHLETSATCGPEACTVIMQHAGTGLVCPLLYLFFHFSSFFVFILFGCF